MTSTISKYDDIIDIRDVIAQVEGLRDIRDNSPEQFMSDDMEELTGLEALLDDLRGNGGDEQWEGHWYPVTLIRDSHFKDYAQQFAEDVGAIDDNARWPCTCIDWDQAARELQMDYSSTEFNETTYWYR
jgi:hypothetical protein